MEKGQNDHQRFDQEQYKDDLITGSRRKVLKTATGAVALTAGATGTAQAQETSVDLIINPNPVVEGNWFTITAEVCKDTSGSWGDFVFGSNPEADITIGIDGVDERYRREDMTIRACRPFEWRLHTNDLDSTLDRHHVFAWTQHDVAEAYLEVQ
ncbi:hypothetical protein [Natronococcus occultus]|uniref:hypothetical protein n=1 Tax=Natronococcus occultus TaxID=29288 RepID=UPI0012F9FB46|nr:hypothetical protein [Natronococcus occultus]